MANSTRTALVLAVAVAAAGCGGIQCTRDNRNDSAELVERGKPVDTGEKPADKGASGAQPKRPGLVAKKGMEVRTLPFIQTPAIAEFIQAGAQIDVLAIGRIDNELRSFKLVEEVRILLVDHPSKSRASTPRFDSLTVSATREQARLLDLATERGCRFEALVRFGRRGTDIDLTWVEEQLKVVTPAGELNGNPNPLLREAPAPRAKGDER